MVAPAHVGGKLTSAGRPYCAQASRCPKLFVSGVDDFGNSDEMRYIGGERIERVSEMEETTRKRVEKM
jgi:hypothetical protein